VPDLDVRQTDDRQRPMIVHEEMHEVRLTGWRTGAQKIAGTKMIRAHTNMGLADAKATIDRCLDAQTTVFTFGSLEPAIAFATDMDELGFVVDVRKSDTGSIVWSHDAENHKKPNKDLQDNLHRSRSGGA